MLAAAKHRSVVCSDRMKRDLEATRTLLLLLTLAATACCTAPPPPPPPPQASEWNCPFPEEADKRAIDSATVTIAVYAGVDGVPQSAIILQDPGYGFGQVAVQCAMTKRYTPGRDRRGTHRASWTPPIRIRFIR